jgi:hypothetical protein
MGPSFFWSESGAVCFMVAGINHLWITELSLLRSFPPADFQVLSSTLCKLGVALASSPVLFSPWLFEAENSE